MKVLRSALSGHNPYFNRWFSAIKLAKRIKLLKNSHNPYFNRWFSAIGIAAIKQFINSKSQSLF